MQCRPECFQATAGAGTRTEWISAKVVARKGEGMSETIDSSVSEGRHLVVCTVAWRECVCEGEGEGETGLGEGENDSGEWMMDELARRR